jgi:dolichol kinase
MGYDIVSLPVTILFILSGSGLFYYAIRLNQKYPMEHNFNNSVLTFLLWITAGIIYPLFFSAYNPNIRFFQILSTFFICVFTPSLIILILFYQYKFVVKKQPDIREKRNIRVFLKTFNQEKRQDSDARSQNLRTDVHRKVLHLFPAGIVILLWIFAVYIWDDIWNANMVWGITGEEFGRFLILTVGYSGILVFGALDYIRLSYIFENRNLFHLIPDNVLNLLSKSMKRKENFDFIRPTVLVLSFAPILFFPFCVFAASILISTIGDGAASLFGLRFGKKKFPKSSEKTIVGYIAGFLASFVIGIITVILFAPVLSSIKILIISITGGFTFLLIDLLNLRIDDNILNPILSATMMAILYYFL